MEPRFEVGFVLMSIVSKLANTKILAAKADWFDLVKFGQIGVESDGNGAHGKKMFALTTLDYA